MENGYLYSTQRIERKLRNTGKLQFLIKLVTKKIRIAALFFQKSYQCMLCKIYECQGRI